MLPMRQSYRIIPIYTADVSGVCSALYELGGMTVMHDPSGCNSTYNTHDEIRWYDQDSLIFISGLTEIDAIMGNDRKFIDSYSLLYGHHMDNGAMFGDVMNYKEKEYFESHKTGTLYLNEQLEKIQWFACVETDAYDEVIYNPQDYKKENLEELMEYIKAHAVQFRLPEKKGKEGRDRIIGLSTCSNDQTNGRVILYGFLYDVDR